MSEREPAPAPGVETETDTEVGVSGPEAAPDLPEPFVRLREVIVREGGSIHYAGLELTADRVTVQEQRRTREIQRSEIEAAWIAGPSEREELILALAGGKQLAFRMPMDDLRRALELLGLSARERAFRMRLGAARARLYGSLGFLGGLVGFSALASALTTNVNLGLFGVLGASAFAGLLAFGAARRPVVAVGADGIELELGGHRRFLGFDQIGAVRLDKSGVQITVSEGEDVSIPVFLSTEERTALRERIDSAREAYAGAASAGAGGDVQDRFERGGRTLSDWRDTVVRALDAGTLSFRSRPVRLEDVHALVSSSDAPREIRIGAALALASRGVAGKDELAAVAAATADERLRRAFEAIVRGTLTDAQLDALLA